MKAFFFDRDGTLNIDDSGYINDPEDMHLITSASKALKHIKLLGYKIIIISNQSGIGRGYYTEQQFREFNDHLVNEFREQGIEISETFYCPHPPEEDCDCRKPSNKFMQTAAEKYHIDLEKSFE